MHESLTGFPRKGGSMLHLWTTDIIQLMGNWTQTYQQFYGLEIQGPRYIEYASQLAKAGNRKSMVKRTYCSEVMQSYIKEQDPYFVLDT
ncbi:hypothetical protein BABINDRAFT_108538 [Babjeviella inositovora NRRL Y-12698]|uniref:Uncharacterized protein n=1 Tax=Babjeviella inositovora NRRL Y-12698 TaxID=984486 RepID=A0A1E3QWZ9_9ASCO|nr:uncharacterized protein BABINDRAFT_108538 [Babjeviella inositovora NRRL Y-12698]ODQ81527.1 hypothetical protein BABINDRAFT_108538 [Babjeviella inositovora NRRL Y-12698]